MGFRRNKGKCLEWKRWLERHRDFLVGSGLPVDVWQDPAHWGYFVEHGSLSTGRPLPRSNPQISETLPLLTQGKITTHGHRH
jgi:hypothetical protein